MLKTALNTIEEVSNPYLLNNLLKTVAENKNGPKIAKFPNICPNIRQNKLKLKKVVYIVQFVIMLHQYVVMLRHAVLPPVFHPE